MSYLKIDPENINMDTNFSKKKRKIYRETEHVSILVFYV